MDLPDLKTPHERLQWARHAWAKRKQQPDSKKAAAARAAVGYEAYKKDESGERSISEARARKYERAFGVPWLWLLYGDQPRMSGFRPDEIALIEKYRRKGAAAREAMHSVADAWPDEIEKAG